MLTFGVSYNTNLMSLETFTQGSCGIVPGTSPIVFRDHVMIVYDDVYVYEHEKCYT